MRYFKQRCRNMTRIIESLHYVLDRRDGKTLAQNVTVYALDLAHLLDHIEDLEKTQKGLRQILDDVGW